MQSLKTKVAKLFSKPEKSPLEVIKRIDALFAEGLIDELKAKAAGEGAASKSAVPEAAEARRPSLMMGAAVPTETKEMQLYRRIAQLKRYLLGERNARDDTWDAPMTAPGENCDQVSNAIIGNGGETEKDGNSMRMLITNLALFEFEARKDIAFIFESLMFNNYGGETGSDVERAQSGCRGKKGFKRAFMLQPLNLELIDHMIGLVSSTENTEEADSNALLYGKMLTACFDYGEHDGDVSVVKDFEANEIMCYYGAKLHLDTFMRGKKAAETDAEESIELTTAAGPLNFLQNADFSMFMTTYGIFEKLMLCSCSRSAARQARDKLKHMKPELYSEDGASASGGGGGGGGSGEDSDDDDEGEASGSTVLAEYLAPLKKNGEDFYSTDALDQDGVRGKWNEFKDAKVFEAFFLKYHQFLLLKSTSFALTFKAMKLLFSMLSHKKNQRLMLEYIKSKTKLGVILTVGFFPREKNRWGDTDEEGKSAAIRKLRYEAFHVLKIFVCNPNRNIRVNYLLSKNRAKLIARLNGAKPNALTQIESGSEIGIDDDEFARAKEEIEQVVQRLNALKPCDQIKAEILAKKEAAATAGGAAAVDEGGVSGSVMLDSLPLARGASKV